MNQFQQVAKDFDSDFETATESSLSDTTQLLLSSINTSRDSSILEIQFKESTSFQILFPWEAKH